jgi:hypothetical protein
MNNYGIQIKYLLLFYVHCDRDYGSHENNMISNTTISNEESWSSMD